jgi:hypothetical protein
LTVGGTATKAGYREENSGHAEPILDRREVMTEGRPERRDAPEQERSAAGAPEPDRYYAEHVTVASGPEGLSVAELQEAINAGSRQSWKLVGVATDPTGQGVILVWDQTGFFSG